MRIVGNPPSGGKKPTTPTIGTATDDGTGTGVSVAFTPSTYIGKGTITYTATSSPGSLTGTGSGSPIVVSGLTTGTAYTFTVAGNTNYGVASDSSAASNSVTPASPTSYESIATVTVGSGGSSTVTFSSIPGTYTHLQVRYISRSGRARTANSNLYMQLNSSYLTSYHLLFGNGASVTAQGASGGLDNSYGFLYTPGTSASANIFGVGVIDILDYANTNKTKVIRALNGDDLNGEGYVALTSGMLNSTSAVTSITFGSADGSGSIPQYSQFALYGVK